MSFELGFGIWGLGCGTLNFLNRRKGTTNVGNEKDRFDNVVLLFISN